MTGTASSSTTVIAPACQKFGINLWQVSAPAFGSANVAIAPLNAYMLLLMTLAGTRGKTAIEIGKALELDIAAQSDLPDHWDTFHGKLTGHPAKKQNADTDVDWLSATAMFCAEGVNIRREFADLCKYSFDSFVSNVDFRSEKAALVINEWASLTTGGRISGLMQQPLDYENKCVITNGVSFKAQLTTPFQPHKTKKEAFLVKGGTSTEVDMMHRSDTFDYLETPSFEAVRLSCRDPRFKVFLFLPKSNRLGELIIENISTPGWSDNFAPADLELGVPRMSFKSRKSLGSPFYRLGIRQVFVENADLSGVADGAPDLYVDDIVQMTWVSIEEEDTQGKSGSRSFGTGMLKQREYKPVMFNRPFMFMVWHEEAQSPLVMGAVSKPEVE